MITAAQLGFVLALATPAGEPAHGDVLEPNNRRLRGNQVTLDLLGGSLTGRALGQTFIVGGRVTYFPIRQLGIGAAYGYSRGIGGLDTVRDRSVHFVHGQLEIPMISALRVGRRKVLEMDLFGEVGAGAVHVARAWQAMGAIGGGVRLYTRVPWLAIRVDALTFLHNTSRDPGTDFDTDVAFTLGVSFLLPNRSGSRR
jgi:hypothetical protein